MTSKRTVLVLGVTGMLGNAIYKFLSKFSNYDVYGTCRNIELAKSLGYGNIFSLNIFDSHSLESIIKSRKYDFIVNCIGAIKQRVESNNYVDYIKVNSLFPHELQRVLETTNTKLIHFSTDCVFTGSRGGYVEMDIPDSMDIYGRSKLLGEIDYSGALTIRTSIIGHANSNNAGLLDWFLAQSDPVTGYVNTYFSGLTTLEVAKVLHYKIFSSDISGLYHLSSCKISKYELLKIASEVYAHKVPLYSGYGPDIDRSLSSDNFKKYTNYTNPSWYEMLTDLKYFYSN